MSSFFLAMLFEILSGTEAFIASTGKAVATHPS